MLEAAAAVGSVAHVHRHVDDTAAGSASSACGDGVAPPRMSTVSARQLPWHGRRVES
jgi:hypothetical protein